MTRDQSIEATTLKYSSFQREDENHCSMLSKHPAKRGNCDLIQALSIDVTSFYKWNICKLNHKGKQPFELELSLELDFCSTLNVIQSIWTNIF